MESPAWRSVPPYLFSPQSPYHCYGTTLFIRFPSVLLIAPFGVRCLAPLCHHLFIRLPGQSGSIVPRRAPAGSWNFWVRTRTRGHPQRNLYREVYSLRMLLWCKKGPADAKWCRPDPYTNLHWTMYKYEKYFSRSATFRCRHALGKCEAAVLPFINSSCNVRR